MDFDGFSCFLVIFMGNVDPMPINIVYIYAILIGIPGGRSGSLNLLNSSILHDFELL